MSPVKRADETRGKIMAVENMNIALQKSVDAAVARLEQNPSDMDAIGEYGKDALSIYRNVAASARGLSRSGKTDAVFLKENQHVIQMCHRASLTLALYIEAASRVFALYNVYIQKADDPDYRRELTSCSKLFMGQVQGLDISQSECNRLIHERRDLSASIRKSQSSPQAAPGKPGPG